MSMQLPTEWHDEIKAAAWPILITMNHVLMFRALAVVVPHRLIRTMPGPVLPKRLRASLLIPTASRPRTCFVQSRPMQWSDILRHHL